MSGKNEALRYNTGKPKWSLVHFKSLLPMVRVLEYGAHKYSVFKSDTLDFIPGSQVTQEQAKKLELLSSGADNWKKGLGRQNIIDSLLRHAAAIADGEWLDEESGLPHIGHLMCNAMFFAV